MVFCSQNTLAMKKKILTLLAAMAFIALHAFGQEQNIKDAYFDFTISRNVKGSEKSIEKTKKILLRSNELSVKQRANVTYHLGRMYEDVGQPDSAIVYYGQSLKGEPNYSVVHRALAFIYLDKSKVFVGQLNAANQAKNADARAKAFKQYKAMVQNALPHLEKYQACEVDEETLVMITSLYKNIKEEQSIVSLPSRLKALSGTCVSLLEDE